MHHCSDGTVKVKVHPTGFLSQQMAPQQPYPMATPFPFQVQLQQDPRTGLFQMIPVPMPAMPHTPGMVPAYSMPVIPPPSPPQQEHQYQMNSQSKQSIYRPQADISEGRSRGVKGRLRSTKVHRLRTAGEGDFDKLNDERCLRLSEVEEGREGRQGGYYENSEEGSDPEMTSNRRRRDRKSNLKRAKSGSHIDYQYSEIDIDASPPSAFSRTTYRSSLRLENGLSHSQPNIGGHQMVVYDTGDTKLQQQKKLDCMSPDDLCSSPPPSPSWSKDSGVSGVNMKGSADATLMERLLNGDTVKHQQKLVRVIQLIRDEFAYDGYLENGIEDLAMAEYILSLGNLKWETFQSAVTEKYCDLYWQDELMTRLYEAVNGQKPVTVTDQRGVIRKMRSKQPKTPPAGAGEPDPMSLLRGAGSRRPRPMSDIHDLVNRPTSGAGSFIQSTPAEN
ncbi:hypothetical protein LSAT2_019857 [Lamellibrachia satsuma]|nr:hypothetical protein LSAT2_019857 [Lamellibrachia satsuma]